MGDLGKNGSDIWCIISCKNIFLKKFWVDTCDLDLIYMVCGEVLVTPAGNLQNKGIIYTFVYDDF